MDVFVCKALKDLLQVSGRPSHSRGAGHPHPRRVFCRAKEGAPPVNLVLPEKRRQGQARPVRGEEATAAEGKARSVLARTFLVLAAILRNSGVKLTACAKVRNKRRAPTPTQGRVASLGAFTPRK